MGLAHSPSIVTNGLVFAYDMANTKKSWKGKPTTNLITNPNSGINVTSTNVPSGVPVTGYSSFNTGYSVIDWAVPSTAATGVTFTYSVYMRSPGGTSTYLMYVYTGTGPDGGWFSAGSGALTDSWQRFTFTSGSWTGNITILRVYRFNQLGTIELAAPQLETNSFATPFVSGTRSTTNNIVDLTGRSTATAGSLTYNSDNTFNFDYTGPGYVSVPLATAFNKTEGTMNFWLYPTRYNGGNGYFVNREDASANAVDWFWIGTYSGSFYFRIGNGADCCSNDLAFGSLSTVIPLDNWINMCFTWKANGTSEIYKNGVLYTSRAIGNIPNTNPASNGRFGLGHTNADNYYNGKMPVAQIYNRQLTAAEILSNFNALRGRYGI